SRNHTAITITLPKCIAESTLASACSNQAESDCSPVPSFRHELVFLLLCIFRSKRLIFEHFSRRIKQIDSPIKERNFNGLGVTYLDSTVLYRSDPAPSI